MGNSDGTELVGTIDGKLSDGKVEGIEEGSGVVSIGDKVGGALNSPKQTKIRAVSTPYFQKCLSIVIFVSLNSFLNVC